MPMLVLPVSKESAYPLFYQARESIRRAIVTGRLKPGDRLPSEKRLALSLGVSLITVRRALDDLQIEGLVTKEHGRGSFVRALPIEQKLDHLAGFAEEMEKLHHQSSAKILDIARVPASEDVARHLIIPVGEEVQKIERVRYADREAIMFNIAFMPVEIGAKIAAEDLTKHGIFPLIEGKYGIPLIEADYQLEASVPPHRAQKALGIKPHDPVFLVRRTAYTDGQRPISYALLYYRSDRFRYAVHVQKVRAANAAVRLRGHLKTVS
ncbi:MAG: GntR family transcriptional regulator [Rhodospirillales bacterium]|nr:GntR family transcriptional regulator [Rhodospirillales bacterium]